MTAGTKTCLYIPIAPTEAFSKIEKSPLKKAKGLVRNTANWLASRVTGRLHLIPYHYETVIATNRGDIAIGESIEELLLDAGIADQIMKVTWGTLSDEIVSRINDECRLFIIGGGGYIFLNGSGQLNRRLEDVPWLEKITCRKVAFAIGLNRLLHEPAFDLSAPLPPQTTELLSRLVACLDGISVRDRETQTLLSHFAHTGVCVIGDPALFLGHAQRLPRRQSAAGELRVGLNLASHGPYAIAMLSDFLPQFVAFLREIKRKHNAHFVYFVHDNLEPPVIGLLRSRGIVLDVVDADPRTMIAAYRTVDIVVSQMLHSSIFCANAETPVLNIAYDQKCFSFFELMGMSDFCIKFNEATEAELVNRFEKLLDARNVIVQRMASRKRELFVETEQFMRRLGGSAPLASPPSERSVPAQDNVVGMARNR